jgi:hypothetical protein
MTATATFAAGLDYEARVTFKDDHAEAIKRATNKLLLIFTHGAREYRTDKMAEGGVERYGLIYHSSGQHRLPYRHWNYVYEGDLKRGFDEAMFSIHYRTEVHDLAVVDFSERTIQKIDKEGNAVGPLLPYGPDYFSRRSEMLTEQGIEPWKYRTDYSALENCMLTDQDMLVIERLTHYVINSAAVLRRPHGSWDDKIPEVPRWAYHLGDIEVRTLDHTFKRPGLMMFPDDFGLENTLIRYPRSTVLHDLVEGTTIPLTRSVKLGEPSGPTQWSIGSRTHRKPW